MLLFLSCSSITSRSGQFLLARLLTVACYHLLVCFIKQEHSLSMEASQQEGFGFDSSSEFQHIVSTRPYWHFYFFKLPWWTTSNLLQNLTQTNFINIHATVSIWEHKLPELHIQEEGAPAAGAAITMFNARNCNILNYNNNVMLKQPTKMTLSFLPSCGGIQSDCFWLNKTKCFYGDYCSTVCKITPSLQEKKHFCSTTEMR